MGKREFRKLDDQNLVYKIEKEDNKSIESCSSILNALSTHIAVVDETGFIIETNEVWNKYTDKQKDNNLLAIKKGDNYLMELINLELKSVYEDIVMVINGINKFYYYDFKINELGQDKWYTLRATPRLDKKGAVIAYSNITDRVISEKKLRKSEREFKSLADSAPNLIVKLNRDLKIEYINKSFLKIDKEQWVGRSYFQLIDPKNEQLVKTKLNNVIKSGESDYFITHRDYQVSAPMILGTNVGPVYNDRGTVQSLILVVSDITVESSDKELLKESEKMYRGIFEGMTEGILHIDEVGTITSVNPGLCKMLGYKASELIGKVCYDFLHDEITSNRLRKKMHYRKKGESSQFEAKFITKSGAALWTTISSQPDYNSNGEFIGVMSIIMDITERKNADLEAMELKEAFTRELEIKVAERTKELEDAKKELAQSLEKEKQLGELKSRFVSTASHQFRTPLSVIQTSMGILSMQADSMGDKFKPVFEKSYQRIKIQIEQMTDLMNDVLILGKINAGNITIRPREIDLEELCGNVVKSYSVINSDNRIALTAHGEPFRVQLDSKLLEHSLSNFISNALKYSPKNSLVELTICFSEDYVTISIKDAGMGIPEDEISHLFEPFYRASNAKDVPGTGLGTSIAKEYIELIGGDVEVKSKLEVGTEFLITFERRNNLIFSEK